MLALIAAAALSAASCASAPIHETGAPDLRLLTCANGLNAVVDARPGSRTVLVRIAVRAGSRDEPAGLGGLAHLLEHLLFKEGHGDSPRHNPAFSALRQAGALVNASTDFEMTAYHADLPADRFHEGWDALVSLVTGTGFDAKDVERERKVVLQEAAMGKTDPMAIVAYSVLRRVFPDDPIGQPVIGFRKSLRRATLADLRAFHAEHYVPARMFAAIVGDVDPEDAAARVAASLGALPPGTPRGPYPAPVAHREPLFRFRTLVSQAYLLTAALTQGEEADDAPALEVLATLLGDGRTSRLHRRLVERDGITDQILAVSFQVSNTGAFGAGAAVAPPGAAVVREVLREEMERLAREPVSDEELAVARTLLAGKMGLMFETNAGIADFRTQRLLYGQDLSRDARQERYDRLDAEALRRTAERVWGGGPHPGPTAIEVLPARGFGKVLAALRFLLFRRL